MSVKFSILYRGPLSSCNYDCFYCPFAKHHETAAELTTDRVALERFTTWVLSRKQNRISVFFTPWGEALTRRWYHEAIAEFTKALPVERIAVQTNLSAPLDWLKETDRGKLGLWCTYHPSQTTRERFLSQCRALDDFGITYSVGMVGLKQDFDEIQKMRAELPKRIYLWINAYKDQPEYYSADELAFLCGIDEYFRWNTEYHASLGRACNAGETVISVDGEGTVRRCHFIREPLGNLYETEIESLLKPRLCSHSTCGCHIGYVHLTHLKQDQIYGEGILERVPARYRELKSPAILIDSPPENQSAERSHHQELSRLEQLPTQK